MTEKTSFGRFLFSVAGTRSCLLGLGMFALIGGQASAFTAYVSNEKSNTISVIDTDKFTGVKTIKVGQRPRGIGLNKHEKFILVAVSVHYTTQMLKHTTHNLDTHPPSPPHP